TTPRSSARPGTGRCEVPVLPARAGAAGGDVVPASGVSGMDLQQWLAYIERQHPRTIELGLERVREVATRLGLERPAAQVVSVAGTNGKGSTVAFIEAIARAGGWKVGAYTSPHLLRYNERVRIDGREASDEA